MVQKVLKNIFMEYQIMVCRLLRLVLVPVVSVKGCVCVGYGWDIHTAIPSPVIVWGLFSTPQL